MPLLAFVDLNKNNFWGESSVIKLEVDTNFFEALTAIMKLMLS